MFLVTNIEEENVFKVYDKIYDHFSDTRISPWDGVMNFIDNLPPDSFGLEIGCGNGKNMIYAKNKGHSISGIDTCQGLIKVCKDKGLNVQHGNAINQTYVDGIFDFCMSIAVFHHLATEESRNKAVMNMINVLKSGGKGLITVWAVEQNGSTNKKFKPGHNIVKWNKPYNIDNKRHYEIYDRYYYVFTEEMFKNYMNFFTKYITINTIFNEKGNWFCEFTKL
tara:strand:+ start:2681 stop:3346 length:666 start_codon:yes stop_codon:yes gene_type:complete